MHYEDKNWVDKIETQNYSECDSLALCFLLFLFAFPFAKKKSNMFERVSPRL